MSTVKVTLAGSQLTVYPTNASATLTYWVDTEGDDTTSTDSKLMAAAADLLPRIGTTPEIATVVGAFGDSHDMRVDNYSISPAGNGHKYTAIVQCESRPKPTIEFGSSTIQSKSSTYLSGAGNGGNGEGTAIINAPERSQMVLDWKVTAGLYGTDQETGTQLPDAEYLLPRVPLTGTALRFGSTIRIGATYYGDEITVAQILKIQNWFVPSTNARDLFYVGDAGYWLCTSLGVVSNDRGYKLGLSCEWTFNPDGWDTLGVYTDPFTKQLAIVKDERLHALSVPIINRADQSVGSPDVEAYSGAGRWPQAFQVDQTALKAFMAQPPGVSIPTLVTDLLTESGAGAEGLWYAPAQPQA